MIAHAFIPPRQYTPPQQGVHTRTAASGALPLTTAHHFTHYEDVVLKVRGC